MPVTYRIRYKLKIIDRRFGSKKYIIYDIISEKSYLKDGKDKPTIFYLHEGYVKARAIVDEMNEKFRRNLRYGKTQKVKAKDSNLTIDNIYNYIIGDEK